MDLINIFDLRSKFDAIVYAINDFLGQQYWLAIFSILLLTFILERLILFLFRRISKLAKRTATKIDDRVIDCSSRPIGNYVLLFGLFIVLHLFRLPLKPIDVKAILFTCIKIAVMLNTLWLIWRLTDVLGNFLISKVVKTSSHLDDQLVPIFEKTVKVFVLIIGAIYVIQATGYSVSGVVAGLGIGGLAVAMASKDTLANLFGSIMIITDRPFRVGDWIKVGDDEGFVEEIGFRSTRIRTFPQTQISVPNSIIANVSINNFSRMPKRRVKMTIGVTYETTADQMDALVKKIRDLLKQHSDVSQDFFLVNFTDFGASSLDILVYYFTKATKWASHMQLRQEINLSIMRIIEESGLSIAFPTRTVYLKSESSESIQD